MATIIPFPVPGASHNASGDHTAHQILSRAMADQLAKSSDPRLRAAAGTYAEAARDPLAATSVLFGEPPQPPASLERARKIIAESYRAFDAWSEAHGKALAVRKAEFPKPKFAYGSLTAPQARKRIADRMPNFDAEDLRIIAALKTYDAERAAWKAATVRIEAEHHVSELYSRWETLEDEARTARELLRANGETPAR